MGSCIKWHEFLKLPQDEAEYGDSLRTYELRNSTQNDQWAKKRAKEYIPLWFFTKISAHVYNYWLFGVFDRNEMVY